MFILVCKHFEIYAGLVLSAYYYESTESFNKAALLLYKYFTV